MNTKILNSEIQDFIVEKSDQNIDLTKFILSGSPFKDITVQELAQQIEGRKKAKLKLPSWFKMSSIYYPPKVNIEQTSSEATALYKSKLVSGDILIDITGGLGIDDYYFAKQVGTIIHCELNPELSKIAQHNFKILEANNITTKQGDGLEILKSNAKVDWIYIDPSRRHDRKGKVFFLEDCLPNVPENLDLLFAQCNNILIKTSPLLDIQVGLRSLRFVKHIHIIALNNEVKELLWELEKDYDGDLIIKTVNIAKEQTQKFSFSFSEEQHIIPTFSKPLSFIYEPNAAIMKSGGFLSISEKTGILKLHPNTHLYTSDKLIDFPGRRFQIISVLPYHKKTLFKTGINKANITTRNFHGTVSNLRKKHKIKDGGQEYLFFTTTTEDKKVIIWCRKV